MRALLDGSPITRGAFSEPDVGFRQCDNCVMDTTDPSISFSDDGLCSYCIRFGPDGARLGVPLEGVATGKDVFRGLAGRSGTRYDCVIGVSGGVDSSFLLAKAVEAGIRPLAVHIDAGWNSETSVGNIHKLVSSLGVDLETKVIDWEKMRKLQIAFLASGVANLDTPQDHVFIAGLIAVARKEKVADVLSGSNMATESILPEAWGYDAMDGRHIKEIYRAHWNQGLNGIPLMSLANFRHFSRAFGRLSFHQPLNHIRYSKKEALDYLEKRFGWVDYGQKHYESRWTRYFQAALLPYRFGYDKRKAHLSSMILSGELSKSEALDSLSTPLYDSSALSDDEKFLANKLELGVDVLSQYKEIRLAHYSDFPNDQARLQSAYQLLRSVRGLSRLRRLISH